MNKADDGLFLPDFCTIRNLLLVCLIGELLAVFLTLAGGGNLKMAWSYLLMISVFIQWIAIACCVALCGLRPCLRRLSQKMAALVAFMTTLLITTTLSYAGLWVMGNRNDGVLSETIIPHNFIFSNIIIAALVSALALRYFYVQYHWKRQIQAESEARVQALQSRIRPHFLFNSMNIIASLTRSKPELAEQVVEDLSDLFRASLTGNQNHTTWQKELSLARQYLHIEGLRLGSRLKVEWHIDAIPDDALLPSLSLQPLLENAIYHGIEPLPEGGTVAIKGNRAGAQLSLLITNPLMTNSLSKNAGNTATGVKQGNQIAQENVRQRFSIFFHGNGTLSAKPARDHYSVTLTFPYEVHK